MIDDSPRGKNKKTFLEDGEVKLIKLATWMKEDNKNIGIVAVLGFLAIYLLNSVFGWIYTLVFSAILRTTF